MHPLLRFTLDLFESNQAVALVNPTQTTVQTELIEPSFPVKSKSRPVVIAPESNLTDGLIPTIFRHPQASREVRLGAALVAYEFKRGKRRTIGFSVGPNGLAVRAPKWTPLYEVDAMLQAKSAWILRKLQETRERHAKLAEQVMDWRDGAKLFFLGQMVTIKLDPEHGFGGVGAELKVVNTGLTGVQEAPNTPQPTMMLCLSLPHNASEDQIRDTVQAWLMRQATRVFQDRLNHFALLLGVQWKKLSLSHAGTRWGSAKIDGSIRLNWRLIHYRTSVIDYVVAHELSHLRVMDHSPRFWDTVRTVVPDYALLRQQLKDGATP